MKKRILSLFLAALMVLTLVPFTGAFVQKALADTKLYGTTIYYGVPAIGKKAGDITRSGSETYFNISMIWYKYISPIKRGAMKDDTVFDEGNYEVEFTLTPKTGYYFEDGFQMVIGNIYKTADPKITLDVENQKITVKQSYVLSRTVSTLQIGTGQTPLEGKTPDNAAPYAQDEYGNNVSSDAADAPTVILDKNNSYWYEGESVQSPSPMKKTDLFQKGKVYTYRFRITPREGFSFADDITFKYATNETVTLKTYYLSSLNTYLVDVTFKNLSLVTKLYGGTLYYSIPAIGKKAGDITYTSSGNISSFDVSMVWSKQNGKLVTYLLAGATFGEGLYGVEFTLTPKAGCYFEDDFKFSVGNIYVPVKEHEITVDVQNQKITVKGLYNLSSKIDVIQLGNSRTPLAGQKAEKGYPYALDKNGNNISADNASIPMVSINTTDCFWYEGSYKESVPEDQRMATTASFEKGKIYTYRYSVSTRSGYSFADNITFKCASADEVSVRSRKLGDHISTYYVDFTYNPVGMTIINPVELTDIQQPVIGETIQYYPGVHAMDPDAFEIESAEWMQELDLDTYEAMPNGTKFEKGKYYVLCLLATPKSGYAFSVVPKFEFCDETGADVACIGISHYSVGQSLAIEIHVAPIEKAEEAYLPGDVDNSGKVDTADARLALRRAIQLETYAEDSPEFKACDVTKDGKVGTDDARFILRHAIGLTDEGIVW